MLTLSGITVRLGGRTILDRASAALPPGSRVGLIAAFIVVHLTLVLLAGPYNEVRSMITGRFRVPPDRDAPALAEKAA